MKLRLLALLSVLLAALTAGARAADKPLFDYHETTLENGLRIVTLEDFSCPIVAVHLWYEVGSKDENPERQGFAHMFEHMMFRGTDRLGPTDHFDLIRRTGGTCNAYTNFDHTTYVQELPANQLDLALWLESERMAFLKINQDSFDTERKVVEEERRLGLNQPYGDVPEKLLSEVFKVHPYRWLPIGKIPHLRAAAVGELRDFWTRYYVPNNATLVIVGAVKHEDAEALAKKYFGWIPRYPDPKRVNAPEPDLERAKEITIKAENAPAPIVGVAFRTVPAGHKDYLALEMLGTVLGGGQSSRLWRELVAEKRSAVIAASAAFSLQQDGFFGAGAVLAPFGGNTKDVLNSIQGQLERARTELVSAEEFEKARMQHMKGVVTQNLTIVSKASALGNAAVVAKDLPSVNRELDEIRALTREDLLRVAQTYLKPERAYVINVERNLLGTLFGGKKKNSEEDAPITATPEKEAPPPGRSGLTRPANFPTTAPVSTLLDAKLTPEFSTKNLSNGLKVITVPNHEVPYVTVQLVFSGGSWTDEKPGVGSMAMSMLTKGTKKHSEGDLARELERYAIDLGGSAGGDSASVGASCLTDQIERAMNLMAEVVMAPTFPEEEFDKLRAQVRTGLAISAATPAYLADKEFRKRLWGDHPYSRTSTGEPEDLDAMKASDLEPWWRAQIRPERAFMIFAGDIEESRALALAEAAFGKWKGEGNPADPKIATPPQAAATKIYLVDRPGVGQSEIRVGQLGLMRSDPDYFTSRIVSDYFGGAFSSRLNETIRVKKGLTYGASGGFSASRFGGTFSIRTFSKTPTTAEAVQAVLDELKRLKSEAPSESELERAKSYIVGSFPGDRETPQAVAGDLRLIELEKLPPDYFDRLLKGVRKTSAADCTRLVGRTPDPDHLVVVVVGDASAIQAALEKIAPVEVVGMKAPKNADD